MKLTKAKFCLFIMLNLCLPFSALAGYLTIVSSSTFNTKVENQELIINGFYEVLNKGDELAQNVFPVLRVGAWEWAGESKTLEPNSKHRWEIDSRILLSKFLDSSEAETLSSLAGQFPLLVRRHYQDLNGFEFSSAEVIPLNIGNFNEQALTQLRIPKLRSTFLCDGNGQEFKCVLSFRDISNTSKNLKINLFSSQELEMLLEGNQIELVANQSANLILKIKNINALAGSSYAVFAVITWKEDNLQRLLIVPTKVQIKEVRIFMKLLLYSISLIGLCTLAYIVIKARKRAMPSK